MAGLLDSRRAPDASAVQLRAVRHRRRRTPRCASFYAQRDGRPARAARRRRAEHRTDVRSAAPSSCARPAEPSSATAEICDRMEAIVDARRAELSRSPSTTAPENLPGGRLPAVPGRRASHDVLACDVTMPSSDRTVAVARALATERCRLRRRGWIALYHGYNREDSAERSRFEHRAALTRAPTDREVAGFCAAALAFGRVASVLNSIETLFALDRAAARAVRARVRSARPHGGHARAWSIAGSRGRRSRRAALDPAADARSVGLDRTVLRRGLRRGTTDVGPCARQLSRRARWRSISGARLRRACRARPGVRYFFPRPSAGSACKRLNLFLRWMVRRDEVDLGVWTSRARRRS